MGRARMQIALAERAIKLGRKEDGLKCCTWLTAYANELALFGKEAEARKFITYAKKFRAILEQKPDPKPKKEEDIF
jgi:hypothetical protein